LLLTENFQRTSYQSCHCRRLTKEVASSVDFHEISPSNLRPKNLMGTHDSAERSCPRAFTPLKEVSINTGCGQHSKGNRNDELFFRIRFRPCWRASRLESFSPCCGSFSVHPLRKPIRVARLLRRKGDLSPSRLLMRSAR
jgi:hypothetical protein